MEMKAVIRACCPLCLWSETLFFFSLFLIPVTADERKVVIRESKGRSVSRGYLLEDQMSHFSLKISASPSSLGFLSFSLNISIFSFYVSLAFGTTL